MAALIAADMKKKWVLKNYDTEYLFHKHTICPRFIFDVLLSVEVFVIRITI